MQIILKQEISQIPYFHHSILSPQKNHLLFMLLAS